MIRRALLAILFGASSGSAQVPFDSATRWIDSVFAPYASARSPGCAVGVTTEGRLAFARGYGVADLSTGRPITADTRFYTASLSKQFTAMSVVLLAKDHRLSLDDTVRRWIPELPSFGKPITIRQLLNHTSGLRDYMTLLGVAGWSNEGGELTNAQFLSLVRRQHTLNFAPGDEFLYSNTGYALLSIIVQRASGESLRDFAFERIFRPLGMTSTEFRDDHRRSVPQAARGYEATANGLRETEARIDVVGDGGVYSTVTDLAKWDANFSNPRVGGADGIAMLIEPGRLNNGQQIPYGFALALGEMGGLKTIAHNGSYDGYRATMLRFPEANIGVITLCNTSTASPLLAEQVGSLVLGVMPRRIVAAPFAAGRTSSFGPAVGSPIPRPTDTAADAQRRNDQLAQIAGGYYSDELDLSVSLAVRDGALYLRRPNQPEIRFGSFTTDLFTSSDKILLRVVREHGTVTGFTLTIDRVRDLEFQRREGNGSSHTPDYLR